MNAHRPFAAMRNHLIRVARQAVRKTGPAPGLFDGIPTQDDIESLHRLITKYGWTELLLPRRP